MASDHSIPAFPADIDRDHFGFYLSGFVDGEGCFGLNLRTHGRRSATIQPSCAFTITLRADDLPILQLIQSFFGCGTVTRGHIDNGKTRTKNSFNFRILNLTKLIHVVIPHFARRPLYAKKKRDFVIWAEAVRFVWRIVSLPQTGSSRRGSWRWTAERLNHYLAFRARLKEQREYNAPTLSLPTPLPQ